MLVDMRIKMLNIQFLKYWIIGTFRLHAIVQIPSYDFQNSPIKYYKYLPLVLIIDNTYILLMQYHKHIHFSQWTKNHTWHA